jgi:hypothetical protein
VHRAVAGEREKTDDARESAVGGRDGSVEASVTAAGDEVKVTKEMAAEAEPFKHELVGIFDRAIARLQLAVDALRPLPEHVRARYLDPLTREVVRAFQLLSKKITINWF